MSLGYVGTEPSKVVQILYLIQSWAQPLPLRETSQSYPALVWVKYHPLRLARTVDQDNLNVKVVQKMQARTKQRGSLFQVDGQS